MSSINTNAGAMTALQTLKATNKNLEITQGRISTGARVNEAAHNAAYWSIATTMRSDNNAMSTVKDALGLGAAQVDIAYTAMDAVKDTLDQMKTKLVAASQPDVDKAKVQEEIKQLQNDLRTYAKSATFSGGNWLDVKENSTQKVVASFIRDGDNNVSLETIDIDTSKFALFEESGKSGMLDWDGVTTVTPGAEEIDTSKLKIGTSVVGDGAIEAQASIENINQLTLADGDTFSFTLQLNDSATSVKFTATMAGGDLAASIETALEEIYGAGASPVDVTEEDMLASDGTTVIGKKLVFEANTTNPGDKVHIGAISAATKGDDPVNASVADFDITELGRGDIQKLLSNVDAVLGKVTTAASDLGAIKTRIGSQQEFVGKIMDAVGRGVGQLVDADMEEESTRLQALQVQQQLGIQALSIANGNTQNILSLFR